MQIVLELQGKGLAQFKGSIEKLARGDAKKVLRLALNHVGPKVATRVKRELVKQTGVKYGAVTKALRTSKASDTDLSYSIVGTGKHFGLTDFNAKQGKRGVMASPWRKRRLFKRTFFGPNRQVFVRLGRSRLPIKKLYGPAIPREMVRDAVPEVFEQVVQSDLGRRIDHEIGRLMP